LSVTNPLGFMGPALAFDKHIVINMNDISNALDQSQSVLYVEYKDSDNFEFKKDEDKVVGDSKNNNYTMDKLISTTKKLYQFDYPFKDASETTA
ncbi:hypothetical protein G6O48_25800, partial [Salmonella enterica subsp. enterica serovar Enteritidis]|nr:hypothetical protein [Salmonella enterica subsp. enterica serovar Enteritidis]